MAFTYNGVHFAADGTRYRSLLAARAWDHFKPAALSGSSVNWQPTALVWKAFQLAQRELDRSAFDEIRSVPDPAAMDDDYWYSLLDDGFAPNIRNKDGTVNVNHPVNLRSKMYNTPQTAKASLEKWAALTRPLDPQSALDELMAGG
jgi:hypothetical protein